MVKVVSLDQVESVEEVVLQKVDLVDHRDQVRVKVKDRVRDGPPAPNPKAEEVLTPLPPRSLPPLLVKVRVKVKVRAREWVMSP